MALALSFLILGATRVIASEGPLLMVDPVFVGVPGDGPNCSGYVPPVTCEVTLSQARDSSGRLPWFARSDTVATFIPSSGVLVGNDAQKVLVVTPACGGYFHFYFYFPSGTATVTYSCG